MMHVFLAWQESNEPPEQEEGRNSKIAADNRLPLLEKSL
jgi:hypothetical protein